MTTKYSDIIKLQDFLPVYDIMDESPKAWQSFIPTKQFCDLLNRSLTAFTSTITSKEVSKRKSIWVRGTFGTGKSHASAVVKHLLCDDYNNVCSYIESLPDEALKARIKNLRQSGRKYFAVTLKGVEKAYDIPRFTLSLQRETQKALKKIYPDFVVQSDFLSAKNWILSHSDIFEANVLGHDDELDSTVSTTEDVLNRLDACDTGMYLMVERAIRKNVGSVFEQQGISDWLVEVEKEIENRGIADGLIIVWDEFTSVMDTLKSDRINLLQNIAEKSQKNNVFLFLISHRIETINSESKEADIRTMNDRFDHIAYQMDQVSTYLIMRHSFTIPDAAGNLEYSNLQKKLAPNLQETLDFVTDNNAEQKQHISRLLPMHPYTAYLCSTISNFVGSSNRSVIKFMHDGESGFEAFLNDESNYNTGTLLTADALWDFFYSEFDEDVASSTFTNIYRSYESTVAAQGDDYLRVFKAILLLNALSPKFKQDPEKLKPVDKVFQLIFAGDRSENKIIDILNWLNDKKVVVRNVFDQFKITGSSYNQAEMNDKRQRVETEYQLAQDIVGYDIPSSESIKDLFKIGETVRREVLVTFLSCEAQEAVIRSRLIKFTQGKPNYLHVAIFFSIRESDRDSKNTILKNFSADFENLVIVLPDEALSQNCYSHFVDSIAHSLVAESHFNKTEAKEYEKAAHQFVIKWIQALLNNTYTCYFNSVAYNEGTVAQIPDLLNYKLSVKAYPHGFESIKEFGKKGVKDNFFVDKNCPSVILQILEAQQASQITSHGGNPEPIRYIFEDNGNTLLTPVGELSEYAKNSDLWITNVCHLMDKCMEDARKKYNDRFSLGEVLAPFVSGPYGFFTSFANCSALAFAIRKHKSDLFVPGVSQPISDDKLRDMLVDIFKAWTKDGKADAPNKYLLRFGSPEETQLKDLIIDLFDLKKYPWCNVKEIKSLENAKWKVWEFCKIESQQPLWTLLYAPGISDEAKDALKDLIYIFEQENPSVDKIKSVYKKLKQDNVVMNILLTNIANYQAGFRVFVSSIEEAPITPALWQGMIEAIDTLQLEIALRQESTVRQKIVAYYVKWLKQQQNGNNGGNGNGESGSGNGSGNGSSGSGTSSTQETIAKAKDKIKSINMPNMFWQKLALDLLNDHPELADYFADLNI